MSASSEPITYRGSDIDELLPRIREELGPDAIVIRQREGLNGGVGGFFQKRCVEVVARRATPGVDAYDALTATPEPAEPAAAPAAPEPRAPAIAEIMRVASPFIEQLRAAEIAVAPAPSVAPAPPIAPEPRFVREPEPVRMPEPVAFAGTQPVTGAFGASAYTVTAGGAMAAARPVLDAPEPVQQAIAQLALVPDERPAVQPDAEQAQQAERTGAAAAHQRALVAAGIAPALAAELIDATVSHVLPFAPKRTLKRALREALARRIPLAAPVAAGGRAVAFVGAGGSGKTLSAARLATAYALHSDLAVTVMSLATPERDNALRELLAPAGVDVLDAHSSGAQLAATARGERALTVIDTSAVSPGSPGEVRRLAAELRRLGSPEVHVAVPATLSGVAVRALLDGFAALEPAAIVLTHLDEVGHAGPVIDEAIARGIAISYASDGSAADGFAPADAADLAARVLA